MSLQIYSDSSCQSLLLSIPDPSTSYQQCAQDSLLIYSAPAVALCESTPKPRVNGTLCPRSLPNHQILDVNLTEGCRLIARSACHEYFINQGCNETGWGSTAVADSARNSTQQPELPEPFKILNMTMPSLIGLAVLLGVIVSVVCCLCCVVRRWKARKADQRFKKIVTSM
jgi:hypothetical protein